MNSNKTDTNQTVNFWAYPPSKPATQETLAWLIPGITDTDDTACGLVPVNQKETRYV